MYLCIGVAIIGLMGFGLCVKRGRRKDGGIYFLILMVSGIFGMLICLEDAVNCQRIIEEYLKKSIDLNMLEGE